MEDPQEDDAILNLRAKRKYIKDWLGKNKQAQDVVPYLQMEADYTDWQIDALTNRPSGAPPLSSTPIAGEAALSLQFLQQAVPMMPYYDSDATASSSSITTSGTVFTYTYVNDVGQQGIPGAIEYSSKHTEAYQQLQLQHDRPGQVHTLLARLPSPSTLQRFEDARKAYVRTRSGLQNRRDAATHMRTVLAGVEGDLWTLARHHHKENMTWATMAKRLAKGSPNGPEHTKLAAQQSHRSALHSTLSDIVKDREPTPSHNLDHVWTQFLDHLYIVLGLVKLP